MACTSWLSYDYNTFNIAVSKVHSINMSNVLYVLRMQRVVTHEFWIIGAVRLLVCLIIHCRSVMSCLLIADAMHITKNYAIYDTLPITMAPLSIAIAQMVICLRLFSPYSSALSSRMPYRNIVYDITPVFRYRMPYYSAISHTTRVTSAIWHENYATSSYPLPNISRL